VSHGGDIRLTRWGGSDDIDQRMILRPVSYDLSFEALCEPWVGNSNFQLFGGEEFFQHRLRFELLDDALAPAGANKLADFSKVIVDTTVQPETVAHPADPKSI
jgi:transposase, IS5 family